MITVINFQEPVKKKVKCELCEKRSRTKECFGKMERNFEQNSMEVQE